MYDFLAGAYWIVLFFVAFKCEHNSIFNTSRCLAYQTIIRDYHKKDVPITKWTKDIKFYAIDNIIYAILGILLLISSSWFLGIIIVLLSGLTALLKKLFSEKTLDRLVQELSENVKHTISRKSKIIQQLVFIWIKLDSAVCYLLIMWGLINHFHIKGDINHMIFYYLGII